MGATILAPRHVVDAIRRYIAKYPFDAVNLRDVSEVTEQTYVATVACYHNQEKDIRILCFHCTDLIWDQSTKEPPMYGLYRDKNSVIGG